MKLHCIVDAPAVSEIFRYKQAHEYTSFLKIKEFIYRCYPNHDAIIKLLESF